MRRPTQQHQVQVVNLHPQKVRAKAANEAYKRNLSQKRNLSHLNRDRGYRHVDRDPILEQVCTYITDSGMSIGDIIEEVLDKSDNTVHLSYGAIANWLNGTTRRPQNFTVSWVALALGYDRKWVKIKSN